MLAARTDIDETYIRDYTRFTETTRELDSGTLDDYAGQMIGTIGRMTDEQRVQWAVKQTYVLLGTLMAACASMGIDACPMEGFQADEYDRILGLSQQGLHAALVVPVGFRSAEDIQAQYAKVRRPLNEMIVQI